MGILEQQLERTATMDELAEAVGIPPSQMREQLQLDSLPLSLNQPLGNEVGERELVDLMADENLMPSDHLVSFGDDLLMTDALLAVLTARERRILESLYGINCAMESSYGVVAQECKLTPSRIKQIAGGAILKLRKLVKEKRMAYG